MTQSPADLENQIVLIRSLHNPGVYPHSCEDLQVIETHISWVVLCGPYAYKIKKAIDLGFLDFSTLAKRKHYCEEELRLNRRLAPELYLQVVYFSGSAAVPELDGCGEPFEFAVKMARFSQRDLLTQVAAENRLQAVQIDHMIREISAFHNRIPRAAGDTPYGMPEQLRLPVDENFTQIRERIRDPGHLQLLAPIQQWSDKQHRLHYREFQRRKRLGFIRECHGDMHLRNMAWTDGRLVIFDGIEFNPALYWIDVMSEVAFLCMDLEDHGYRNFAYRFLNGYLEITGDYEGLGILRYYLAYRAMVRAKVTSIRMQQETEPGRVTADAEEFAAYLNLALGYTRPAKPLLIITHGLSGSGKSTLSGPLAERMGAIRVRSDRERQRMFGRAAAAAGTAKIDAGVYSPAASERTYERLRELTEVILESGYSAIVDATFLKREQRKPFKALADRLGLEMRILYFQAEEKILRTRVRQRQQDAREISEADLEVLDHQLAAYAGLADDELGYTITIDTEKITDFAQVYQVVHTALH